MSTTAEVSMPAPTPAVSEYRCSRCGQPIEAEGEHVELFSRNLIYDLRAGFEAALVGELKTLPGNRYCVGCSGPIFNAIARSSGAPEIINTLLPDTVIGQHLNEIVRKVRIRDNEHSGKTVMSLRWFENKKYIYVLWVDHGTGDYREYHYDLAHKSLGNVAGPPAHLDKVVSLLVTNAPESVQQSMRDYIPKWEQPKATKKAPKKPGTLKVSLQPLPHVRILDEVADEAPEHTWLHADDEEEPENERG